MKRQRQNALLALIGGGEARTQEALLDGLRRRGFEATQATVSRDLRELRVTKSPAPDGGYHYTLPDAAAVPASARLTAVMREAVNGCECAKNLVVVKTMPGLAPAACYAIDAMNRPGVLGTLAGEDTGLAVCRDDETAERLRDDILGMIR
jgi:transcriptional regulator of arginine metabolism